MWLSCYPRSGSSFLRLILNQAFGLRSTSLYEGESARWDIAPGVGDLVGHYERGRRDGSGERKDPEIVKTNEPPLDDAPAIYLIRDGRSAIVSYFHYLNDIQGLPATMEELIRGEIFPGFWADHYKAWAPQRRARTLFLRYEELTAPSKEAGARIADFLGKPAVNDLKLGFADLHKMFPAYFRCGDDRKNIAEIQPHQKLFELDSRRRHAGAWLLLNRYSLDTNECVAIVWSLSEKSHAGRKQTRAWFLGTTATPSAAEFSDRSVVIRVGAGLRDA